jgi:type I restriction enzyme M protein
MGTIFEELVRKFSEQSNEEAGDHFTPREVVELMTHLMFEVHKDEIKKENLIKTVYDPACGTGGMLTSSKNYIGSINPKMEVVLFGQELLEEIYAICKADMLMKGEGSENIKGPISTLSKDQFPDLKFDYIISNPPYGKKWEMDEEAVTKESTRGHEGRFGAGLPRINDGQLLFLQHMVSKMKVNGEKSEFLITTVPIITGAAGQGESEIRKWIIENDYLETIIAVPNQLFYNTGINTYIWILSNQKESKRVGKIQLIDATQFFKKMRKSLGNKRNELSPEHINKIVELYKNFEENEYCKIFDNEEFGYTKVIVERPLQLNFEVTDERLENLYSFSAFAKLSQSNAKNPEEKLEEETKGKEKQQAIIKALKSIGNEKFKSWDKFEEKIKKALKEFNLPANFIKNIILSLSEHDDTADYVLDAKGNRQVDSNLRDSEKIPLKQDIDIYFKEEVKPYYADAWMDRSKERSDMKKLHEVFVPYELQESLKLLKKISINLLKRYKNS